MARVSSVAPVTTDELTIGKIVALVAAARALLIEEPMAERTRLVKVLIEAGTGMRELWIKEIEATRAGEEGLTIVELGDGWVRVEDPWLFIGGPSIVWSTTWLPRCFIRAGMRTNSRHQQSRFRMRPNGCPGTA